MADNRFKSAGDFRKSLEARLQKVAKETGTDLQRVRRRVAFDRLLARFFLHSNPPFFLKGGYAMELRLSSARATKDIDLTYLDRLHKNGEPFADSVLHSLQELAAVDLGEFFTYTLGTAQLELDNAPYGGARYPVASYIDGKLFVRFHLDVGGDLLVAGTETLTTPDWLDFCGTPAPTVRMISIEQQIAEKIHAYTLPRGARPNSRVKDLVDILLLMHMRTLDLEKAASVLRLVFRARNTHPQPLALPPPPMDWTTPYIGLASECGVEQNIEVAFRQVSHLYSNALKPPTSPVTPGETRAIIMGESIN